MPRATSLNRIFLEFVPSFAFLPPALSQLTIEDAQRVMRCLIYATKFSAFVLRMLNQTAVGKGLNVKGKSAKRNHLSGFVPFLQISDNKHKRRLGRCPENSRVILYFQTKEQQELAKLELEIVMKDLQSGHELDPIRLGRLCFACIVIHLLSSSDSVPRVFCCFLLLGMEHLCRIESSYSHVWGLDMPELLLREAYIFRPDITFQALGSPAT